jgi:hypothetical protein
MTTTRAMQSYQHSSWPASPSPSSVPAERATPRHNAIAPPVGEVHISVHPSPLVGNENAFDKHMMETTLAANRLTLMSAMGTVGLFVNGRLLKCGKGVSSKVVAEDMVGLGLRWLKVTTVELAVADRERRRELAEKVREATTVPPKKKRGRPRKKPKA